MVVQQNVTVFSPKMNKDHLHRPLLSSQSTLYRSELLDTNPDKNIVLVLGGDDASFVKEVRRVLAGIDCVCECSFVKKR